MTGTPPAALSRAARTMLGGSGHRDLARFLGQHHPDGPCDQADPRLVRRWFSGQRDIPDWVAVAITRRLRETASDLLEAAELLAPEE